MQHVNILTRRSFMDRSFKIGLGVALATLTDIPLVVKRALAEGNIGLNGKKLFFIWLRGANDGLNSVVPIGDTYYGSGIRPTIGIPADAATNYATAGPCDVPALPTAASSTFGSYPFAIRLGNGFAALHPSLKFLAPVYNAGDLALIHRVGYPQQSRSHFDSQNYWENGTPNNNLTTDGIFYRTMLESGLATTNSLTGVSIQSALPLILRGSGAAMTNLSDPTRYNLLGIPNNTAGNNKADNFLNTANGYPFPDKLNRELLNLQYQNLSKTLQTFASINFTDVDPDASNNPVAGDGNYFRDDISTDGDTPYYLFPTRSKKNGGYQVHNSDTNKYVIDTGGFSLFTSIKSAALILNQTDAIIAGTEFSGFDTHNVQGGVTGSHANLQRRIGWAIYALRKFFKIYGKGGSSPMPNAQVGWNDVVIVTLSEFGRTTIENGSLGTDHAEAGVLFLAGGAVKGYNKGNNSGVFGCGASGSVVNTRDTQLWFPGPANQGGPNNDGTMVGVIDRYLKRSIDYRSILGEIIRNHLGATQNQLNRIIPGYTNEAQEHLLGGGTSAIDSTPIVGEPGFL